MQAYKNIIFVISLFWLLSSCDLSDKNVDPSQDFDVGLNEILPVIMTQSAYNTGAVMARLSGHMMQHWDITAAVSVRDLVTYNYSHFYFDDYWNFGAYSGTMGSAALLIREAESENDLRYVAIAKILMAKELGVLTSSFGNVPFSEALRVEIIKSKYDDQESVYQSIQQLLDEAIEILNQGGVSNVEGDLIFNGDLEKWKQTAHALKARFYMHLSKRDPQVANKVLEQVNLAFVGHENQPDFYFGTTYNSAGPLAKFGIEHHKTMIIHNTLNEKMTVKSDPRISKYMYYDNTDWQYFEQGQGLFWSENTSPQPLISYTEIKFLEAEAHLMNGNATEAENAMIAAVQDNMDYLVVETSLSLNYINSQVNFSGLNTDSERLEKLMNEKYVALYGQGAIELWVDYRRTGYPQLTPHPNGTNEFNPNGQIPNRFIYPTHEYSFNKENVEAAAVEIGGDLLSTKLWAFE